VATKADQKYDVVAVNIETRIVRVLATDKTLPNAEAIVKMAVMRRGVDEEFFAEVKSGLCKEGAVWKGG